MVREPGPTEVLRSRPARALGLAMVVSALVGLGALITEGSSSVVQYGAVVGLFGFMGWAAFVQPHVEVSDGGVRIANTWRTVDVPWPAVVGVEGRYGLQLRTAYGAVTAWGAPVPAGRERARNKMGPAAAQVSARLEELRAAGYLDHPVLERPRPVVTWHRATIAAAVVLLVAAILLPLVG